MGEAEGLCILIQNLETMYQNDYRPFSEDFSQAAKFRKYLAYARKWTVKKEGWRRAVISNPFGVNKTGVFRPALDLLRNSINENGDIKSLLSFRNIIGMVSVRLATQ